ncbi:hypothetical protein D3C79_444210 [compost metagenome]
MYLLLLFPQLYQTSLEGGRYIDIEAELPGSTIVAQLQSFELVGKDDVALQRDDRVMLGIDFVSEQKVRQCRDPVVAQGDRADVFQCFSAQPVRPTVERHAIKSKVVQLHAVEIEC